MLIVDGYPSAKGRRDMQWNLQGDDRRAEQHNRAGRRTQPAVDVGYALPMQPPRWSHALCSTEQEFIARAAPYQRGNRRQPTSKVEGRHMRVCMCVRAGARASRVALLSTR